MADRISGFRRPEGAADDRERYRDLAARLWPVPHDELDVQTRFRNISSDRTHTSANPQRLPEGLAQTTAKSNRVYCTACLGSRCPT